MPVLFKDNLVDLVTNNKDGSLQNAVLQPVILGVVSLLLAVIVASLGNGISTKVAQFPTQIPVQAVNLASGLSANVTSNQNVTIFISAPRSVWNTLTADSFSATVDTTKQTEGTYDLVVSVSTKVSAAKIVSIAPTSVSVTIEPVIKKTVPVVVKYKGQAGTGLVPDSPQLTPDKVDVTGAKSVMANITHAVATVALNGETGAIEQKPDVAVIDPSGNSITNLIINPALIDVKVNLIKPGLTKVVGVLPVITGQPGSGYWVKTVSTNPSTVSITGQPDVLSAISQINTAALSVSGITTTTNIKATLTVPSGITLVDTTIQTVTVTVTLDQTSTTKTITPEINYTNLSAGLQVSTTTPTSISSIVSGLSATLSSLLDGAVKVALDLSAYKSAGTYSVTITNSNFTLPSGVSLTSFLPSAISVTLVSK